MSILINQTMLHWQLSKRVLPDYDEERVYPSDIKKINWYNMMQAKGSC
jgi:hypothetical protein